MVIFATETCSCRLAPLGCSRVAGKHTVNVRVRYKIRMNLCDTHIQRSIVTQRCRPRGAVREQAVQLDAEITAARAITVKAVCTSEECTHKAVLNATDVTTCALDTFDGQDEIDDHPSSFRWCLVGALNVLSRNCVGLLV